MYTDEKRSIVDLIVLKIGQTSQFVCTEFTYLVKEDEIVSVRDFQRAKVAESCSCRSLHQIVNRMYSVDGIRAAFSNH